MGTAKCHFCDNKATKLCDKTLSDLSGFAAYPIRTCDNLICDDCAEVQAVVFSHPSGPVGHGGFTRIKGSTDTRDYCPFHSGASRKELIKGVNTN